MRWKMGAVACLLTLVSAKAWAQSPTPVSPAGHSGVALVAGRCPTFHWTAVEGAESVDLLVYRLPEAAEGPPARVLSVTLPGSAQGWTPSLGQCLEPGASYAWSVGTGGLWSDATLFKVSTAPSVKEVEEAIAVLRRYVQAGEVATGPAEQWQPRESKAETSLRPQALRSKSVGAGPPPATVTPPGSYDLSISGDFDLGGQVFKDGYPFLHNDGGPSSYNTALGLDALVSSTPGIPSYFSGRYNTAFGQAALRDNDEGSSNTAVGRNALSNNAAGASNTAVGANALSASVSGEANTALGERALFVNSSGSRNTAVGASAMNNNRTGYRNTAIGGLALAINDDGERNAGVGYGALYSNTSGDDNTALGSVALNSNTTGSRNIALGQRAGYDLGDVYPPTGASTYSDNIFIGNEGAVDDEGVIKIGTQGTQTATYIAGIVDTPLTGRDPVHIITSGPSTGRLGIDTSSRRFKEDVREMGEVSSGLLELRPVTFRYRREYAGNDQRRGYGLVAEEVAEVFPHLVGYDDDGEPFSVRYHLLPTMLLNELQKQHRRIEVQGWLLGLMLLTGVAGAVGRWRLG